MIAVLYLCIIIVPKRPKKNLKTIITQDASQIEKENFVDYLNYERERRKQLREAAAAQADLELTEAVEEAKRKLQEIEEEQARLENRDNNK
jgi:microcompartment protein CcmL/EutN